MVTLEDVDKLKVPELKAACKELGLEQGGKKEELVARLKAALAAQQPAGGAEAMAADADASAEAPAEEAKPVAEAAPATAADAKPEAEGAAPAPADAGDGKRAKITFNDAEAAKFEAVKVQVVNAAPAADKPKQVSEAERLAQRKDRFKDPDDDRKKQRAQRFNILDPDLEKEKQLKRAERFGTKHPELEQKKKDQRAARFGIVDEETKKKQRLDKFKPLTEAAAEKANFNIALKGDEDFEAKRKARAARFAAAT
ncbi:hypothetical protein CHLRE_03g176100v5 [Chlamydomonas reinhardtii]|uniref:Uncharacterized protein n=1 Tax=Chlamydomonas reinhardtii TaxID=3055 RepID=A8IDY8_CHLRE|nr:uncharacterized protein CHLRE_03g176100v5 [Chlamydomonas reinhardtii]PNW85204.1 hypothetical protein CHLRE_03g176100v5 [Chlamydomonas reinhardtii]|eukprot:XP_001703442.1 hypothetical protein CHLREDRAFT_182801 [Chlamydomonas reinhardtii]